VAATCALLPLPLCRGVPPGNEREGKEGGKGAPTRGESGACLPYLGMLGEPNSSSALPEIYLSVIL